MAYSNRAHSNNKLGKYEEALKDFNYILKQDKDDMLTYFYRGVTYDNLKQYDKAIQDYNRVLNNTPIFAEGFFERALSKFSLLDFSGGCNDLKKAKSLGYERAADLEKVFCK